LPAYPEEFLDYLGDTFGPQRDKAPKGRRADAAPEICIKFPDFNSADCRFRMDGTDQKVLWANFSTLLDLVYQRSDAPEQVDRCLEFQEVARAFSDIFADLYGRADLTPPEIDALQLKIDNFCRHFVDAFSKHDVTNYIHALQAGHFRFFLRRYGNMYKYANIGLEACVKVVRTFIRRGTQQGGHCGNQRSALKPRVRVQKGAR
ncbi:hypothetical protein B484DRAFT_440440, partial [Ochromonadaceae sp. CCMP2298]